MYRPLRISIRTLWKYSSPAKKVLEPGNVFSQAKTFSASDIAEYSKLTRDFNPIHSDPDRAKIAGFDRVPVPGILVASFFLRRITSNFPSAVYAKQTLEFRRTAIRVDSGEDDFSELVRQRRAFLLVRRGLGRVAISGPSHPMERLRRQSRDKKGSLDELAEMMHDGGLGAAGRLGCAAMVTGGDGNKRNTAAIGY
ncbi:Thioesterase superfamily protein [Striga hermonthica]|uniref:Thioesterase superfamily protein n=1 Tax=Striga hermonthica TaxID=68872 RepID=A0A9N7NAK9_STRHE|nr:Thioesterase superfamily protein [Striga hermonthica]